MIKNTGDAANPKMSVNTKGAGKNQWVQLFLPFTYDASKTCEIDLEMLTTGTYCVDKLQIFKAEDATGIVLDETSVELEQKETVKLTAGLNPGSATTKVTYSWASDNESVAVVDQNGEVTAVGEGTATITATARVYEYDFANRKWNATNTYWTAEATVTVPGA